MLQIMKTLLNDVSSIFQFWGLADHRNEDIYTYFRSEYKGDHYNAYLYFKNTGRMPSNG